MEAFVHERGRDFAAGIWVVDPAFMLDLVHEQLKDGDTTPAREEAYFAGARIDDDELRDAATEDQQRRAQARARQADATRSNLGLGHDIRAGLIEPTDAQLGALREIVCRLLVRHHRELIAYGAGWTDPECQQPVGDSARRDGQLPSCSTPPGSLAPRHSAPRAWRVSFATPSRAATVRSGRPCGTSCGRPSRRHLPRSTATHSSSIRASKSPLTSRASAPSPTSTSSRSTAQRR